MNLPYLCLLAMAGLVFVLQRRQLRRAEEERLRLVAEHGRALAGVQVELEATREALVARAGETAVTEAMTALVAAVGAHLEKAAARISFDAPEARARLEVYRRPHLPAVVATVGTAARYQAEIAALAELDPDHAFQLRVAQAARAAAALVEAVRLAPTATPSRASTGL